MPQADVKSQQELFLLLHGLSSDTLNGMSATQLDRIQEELNGFLLNVHLARNTKAIINTVIKDIIYRIFTICVFSSKNPVRQALDLSHVCHHWRQLALGWPVLWTTMDLRYRNLSQLCLERNAMAPIDLVVSDRPHPHFSPRYYVIPEWSRQHHLIPELIPRLRSLTIHIDDPSHSEDVLRYFQSTSVVDLQELDIHLPHLESSPVPVPEFFLNATKPLRSLSLDRVILKWNNPDVRGLRRLSLLAPTVPPTLKEFMALLLASPELEVLEMKWIFPPVYPAHHPIAPLVNTSTSTSINPRSLEFDGPVVELPRLEKLTIALVTSMCLPFFKVLLDNIHVPALKSLFIDSPYYDTAATTNHPFNLLPTNPPYPFDGLKHIHVTQMQQPPGPCVLKGRRVCNGHSMGLRDESDMDIFVRSPVPDADPTNFESLLRLLKSMQGVEHLELYVDAWNYLHADSGIDLFTAMPKLLTLEISGEQTTMDDAPKLWDRLVLHENLPLTTLCLRYVGCDNEVLMELVTNTRIRNIHLDHCEGVDAHGVAALREFGVLVHTSEEMSTEEMISLWGESWTISWPRVF